MSKHTRQHSERSQSVAKHARFGSFQIGLVRGLYVIQITMILLAVFVENVATGQTRQLVLTTFESEASGPDEDEKQRYPKLNEMQLPTVEEIFKKHPFDWVVTNNEDVHIVYPVSPRPDRSNKWEKDIRNLLENRPKGYPRRGLLEVVLHEDGILEDGNHEDSSYEIDKRRIQQIKYYEDLVLERVDKLLEKKAFRQAFALILFLERRRDSNWPGMDRRKNRLIFLDAMRMRDQKKPQSALVFFEDLYARDPEYRDSQDRTLQEEIGQVCDGLIRAALVQSDFRQARFFLRRLTDMDPQHQVAVKWKADLVARAKNLLTQSANASQDGKHDEAVSLLDRATRIWPTTPGLRDAHRKASNRFQRIKVGVLRFAGDPTPYFLPTDEDKRHNHLIQTTLFEIDRSDEAPHYRSRFFEEWEPTDLGRQMVFTLRQSRSYWESQPVVTASSIASTLAARLDPTHPAYDERMASYIHSLTPRSPFELVVNFSRVPVRTVALFRFPLIAVESELNSGETVDSNELKLASKVLSWRFKIHEKSPQRVVYRRIAPEPENVNEYHVAEVAKIKFNSYDKAIQGLNRGEVSMLPRVPIWTIDKFRNDERYVVRDYALPTTHVLQFNPNSEPLKNLVLRRAMAYALNRRQVLTEIILHDSESRRGRIVSAPFPSNSYAYADLSMVVPREHDLKLAYALAVVAEKQLKEKFRPLKLYCPPEPVVKAAAEKLIEQWKRIGVTVTLITQSAARPTRRSAMRPQWDLVYRTIQMAEPILELWPFLTIDTQAHVTSLIHLPDWLRQELVGLDQAGDWETAVSLLHRLHQQLAAYVHSIPLWEVDDVIVIRKTVRGFPKHPIHSYQDIERWIVQPEFPTVLPLGPKIRGKIGKKL